MKTLVSLLILTILVLSCNSQTYSHLQQSSPKTGRIVNYQKTATCPPAQIYSPRSPNEVAEIVTKAAQKGHRVMTGTKSYKSQSDAACADRGQVQILTTNLQELKIHKNKLTVTAQSGARLSAINEALANEGLAINMISEGGFFTVGGLLGSGTHGSSLRQGASLEDYITAVTIVDGKGRLRKIRDQATLRSLRVNLGVLGVLVDASFKVEPLKKVKAQIVKDSDQDLAMDLSKLAQENYSVSAAWFPGLGQYTATIYNFVANDTPGNAYNAQAHVNDFTFKLFRRSFQLAHGEPSGILTCQLAKIRKRLRSRSYFKENGKAVKDPVGWSHKMQYFTCTPGGSCPWEILPIYMGGVSIPISDLDQWVAEAKKIHRSYHSYFNPVCFPLNGIYFRFGKASDAHLALSSGEDSVFIDLEYAVNMRNSKTKDGIRDIVKPPQHIHIYQELIEMSRRKFNARPHWGKNSPITFKGVGPKEYPQWSQFIATKEALDPENTFSNDFWERLLSEKETPPATREGCAIQGLCECQEDSDCLAPLRCQSALGVSDFNVCRR